MSFAKRYCVTHPLRGPFALALLVLSCAPAIAARDSYNCPGFLKQSINIKVVDHRSAQFGNRHAG